MRTGFQHQPNKADKVQQHWQETDELYDSFDSFNQPNSEETVQTKLEIGEPGDQYEQEADAMADSVVGNSSAPSISSVGTSVQQSGSGNTASPELQDQINSTKGSGSSLPSDIQHEMGSKIGADFSDVKIHRGNIATRMNEDLAARAFTHDKDIYFNEGNYNPNTIEGKHLLAHELTHTVQQGGAGVKPKIQRAMKFEIQTKNYAWIKENNSDDGLRPLKRKEGPYGPTEDGDVPAYITTGKHGRKARKEDTEYYEEVKGDTVMKKIGTTWLPDPSADATKAPEKVEYILVTNYQHYKDTGEIPSEEHLDRDFNPKEKDIPAEYHKKTLKDVTEHDDIRLPFMPDTHQHVYYDADTYVENEKADDTILRPVYNRNTPASVYLDKKGRFISDPKGEVKHLVKDKKGRWLPIKEKDANPSLAPEKVKYYKIPSLKGLIDSDDKMDHETLKNYEFEPKKRDILEKDQEKLLEHRLEVPDTRDVDSFIPGTKQFVYFDKANYTNGSVNDPLDVHRDEEGKFVDGAVKHMRKYVSRDGFNSEIGTTYKIDTPAQFIKEYQFSEKVDIDKVKGKSVNEVTGINGKAATLVPIKETDHAKDNPSIDFVKNTFEFRYFNANDAVRDNSTLLQIHLDEEGKFVDGHANWMRVGTAASKDINYDLDAEFTRVFKVTEDTNGDVSYFDPDQGITGKEVMVNVVEVTELAIDHEGEAGKDFNAGTYELMYYKDDQFKSSTELKPSAEYMDVHKDDARLKPGHVKFMNKYVSKGQKVNVWPWEPEHIGVKDVGEEQTAIELQGETDGKIEFETPKWFRTWEELRLRVQDAVDIAKEISGAPVAKEEEVSTDQKDEMKKEKGSLGTIHTWPEHLINDDVKSRLGKKKLFAEIVYTNWDYSFFQTSEGISMENVGNILQDPQVDESWSSNVSSWVEIVFRKVKDASAFSTQDDSLFNGLKSFMEYVINYIIWGQNRHYGGGGHKDTFRMMARTDFGSMYTLLLTPDEQDLFDDMVDKDAPDGDPLLLTEIEDKINTALTVDVVWDKDIQFYRRGHNAGEDANPTVYSWLKAIPTDKDILTQEDSGVDVGDVAAAIGGSEVNPIPGNKDYKQALVEKRVGNRWVNADEWVDYAEERFEEARTRSGDTPDDPSTPDVNEASKTSIKLE